ncbi:hypothetical protein ACJX0J_034245, partial [Zea mays]
MSPTMYGTTTSVHAYLIWFSVNCLNRTPASHERSGHGVMFWHGTKFYYPDVFMMDAHVFRLERANEEYYSMLRSLAFNDTGIAFGIGFGANPAWGLDHGD